MAYCTKLKKDSGMDYQAALNIALSLASFLGGYVLYSIRESIKSLQQRDSELTDKVQHIEVLVAGQYVKRDDMEKLSAALFTKLDKIDAKLDNKADK
jgi:hypothetical protein